MEIPFTVPDPQTRKRKIHCKQELIIQSLQRFYSSVPDIHEVVELLKGEGSISLRLIDWFVTNYAKFHTTSYILNGQEFVVYMNYKNQLKAYSKKLFDPFCRRERILFQIPHEEPFLTTVGKLNFFRWAIEKKIIEYIKGHQPEIEKEMNLAMREQAKQRNDTRDSDISTVSAASGASAASSASAYAASAASGEVSTTSSGTRRRKATRDISTIHLLQKHECSVVMSFE